MTESDFISLIDCRFPYHDSLEAERLIVLGCSISPNAAFMVVDELLRVPVSVTVTPERRLALLQHVDTHFKHPIKDLVLAVAEQSIRGTGQSLLQTIANMHAIAPFPNQYCALSVVYSSANEPWEELDSLFNQIVERWNLES